MRGKKSRVKMCNEKISTFYSIILKTNILPQFDFLSQDVDLYFSFIFFFSLHLGTRPFKLLEPIKKKEEKNTHFFFSSFLQNISILQFFFIYIKIRYLNLINFKVLAWGFRELWERQRISNAQHGYYWKYWNDWFCTNNI